MANPIPISYIIDDSGQFVRVIFDQEVYGSNEEILKNLFALTLNGVSNAIVSIPFSIGVGSTTWDLYTDGLYVQGDTGTIQYTVGDLVNIGNDYVLSFGPVDISFYIPPTPPTPSDKISIFSEVDKIGNRAYPLTIPQITVNGTTYAVNYSESNNIFYNLDPYEITSPFTVVFDTDYNNAKVTYTISQSYPDYNFLLYKTPFDGIPLVIRDTGETEIVIRARTSFNDIGSAMKCGMTSDLALWRFKIIS